MRISILAPLLAAMAVSACTSTSGVDSLNVGGTSSETTNSIVRPVRPVPQVDVAPAMASPQMNAPVEPEPMPSRMIAPVARQAEPAPERFEQSQQAEPAVLSVPEPQSRPLQLASTARLSKSAMTFGRNKTYNPRFRDADPISFGPIKPKSFPIHGVDVSRWQGNIDWAKLRTQGANFAYIKSTDGGDHIDPMFRKNWAGAGKAGLKRGAYHFFYWCRSGSEQADWFIRNVPRAENALPPVIDVEYNHASSCKKRPSPELARKKMKAFMDKIEAHYGQRPVIYTAPDFYADNLRGYFTEYPFWLRSTAAHPSKRYPGRKWVFWQYSGTGLSHGVKGEIDLNVFNGDASAWNRWLAKTSG